MELTNVGEGVGDGVETWYSRSWSMLMETCEGEMGSGRSQLGDDGDSTDAFRE